MLDEIYTRLLLELTPKNLNLDIYRAHPVSREDDAVSNLRQSYGNIVQAIYKQDPDSSIGLFYGQLLRPHLLCDFSRVLMTSPNFGTALHTISDLHYMGTSFYLIVHEDAQSLSVSLVYPYKKQVSNEHRRFCAEAVFRYLKNLASDCLHAYAGPSRVCLDYKAPRYSADYDEAFGCEIMFDQALAMIEFPIDYRETPLTTSNHTLHTIYSKKCWDAAKKAERRWPFDYRVVSTLLRNHPDTFSAPQIAAVLSISPRGLQKKLNQLGTSFSTLTSQVRNELSKAYLVQHKAGIEQTAEHLGFQTSSGFRRFFKAENGISASKFLEQECA